MIVSCASCGKRFKGTSGSRKFKCSACGNLFTFPATAKSPAPGNILCSNCWTEIKSQPDLKSCPMCQQKLSPQHGGQASEESSVLDAAGRSHEGQEQQQQAGAQTGGEQQAAGRDSAAQERDAALLKAEMAEARAKDAEQRAEQAEARGKEAEQKAEQAEARAKDAEQKAEQAKTGVKEAEPAEAQALEAQQKAEQAEARAREMEEKLNAYRQAALTALEPLMPEFTRATQALATDIGSAQALVGQARQHLAATSLPNDRLQGLAEMQRLETLLAELKTRIEAMQADLSSRFQAVLGGGGEG
jgi:DNA-directed RNA polymerase subunit RPC12/RpoP/chromosome segregation ATPase